MDRLTHHAQARMQQRGISGATLEALLEFGSTTPAGGGCEIVFFDKRARARLAKASPIAAAEADRIVKSYVIVGSDGTVVTVGHRTRRIPRG